MIVVRFNAAVLLLLAVLVNSALSTYINYTTVTGFFLQDEPDTVASGFDYTQHMWGLINRTYPTDSQNGYSNCKPKQNLTQWQKFDRYVKALRKTAPSNIDYKVIFMGRHGEGYHNAAESFFGTPAWNCYYAELNGNSTATWADAKLTSNGIQQARIANNFWRYSIKVAKIPTPQSYYSSPLWRCLDTAQITFSDLDLQGKSKFLPLVKEYLREGITGQTCNRRRSKQTIATNFPLFTFEDGFTQYDEIWSYATGETGAGQSIRSKRLLDDIFTHDNNAWISFSSHSGEIASILSVLGHRSFSLGTGQVIPVLIKAETLDAAPPPPSATITSGTTGVTSTSAPASTPYLHCTEPPVTSISGTGCVCPNGVPPTVTPLVPNGQYVNKRSRHREI